MATSSVRGKTDRMNEDLTKAILGQIREDELVAMCSDVVNIPSPTGEELEMGRYIRAALEAAGLTVTWQEVEPGRANVLGLWEGTGNGKSLMFNGHMDTSNTGREEFLTGIGYKPKAIIKNGFIYGLGIYNMKGALVCYTQAIKALKRAGMKLKVAAKVDKADAEYFETVIRPTMDNPLIEFVGEIGYPDKCEFLGNAAALIFPINWPEPFGLVMIEAMACGTPVIAYPFGSVPEVLDQGVTGFLVSDAEEAAGAVARIADINRAGCRRVFEERFSTRRMTHDYLAIYQRLIGEEPEPLTLSDGVSVG